MADTPTFGYQRDSIVKRALRQCGAIASGETPSAQEVTDACDALNALISGWQASGIHVWKEKEGTLFLQPNQYQYGIGYNVGGVSSESGTALSASNVCLAQNLVSLSVTSSLAIGVTAIPVASSAGVSVGDNFGVMMSNNQLFWSTVDSVGSEVVTLATGVTASVTSGANAFDYPQLTSTPSPCAIYRPLRVLNVRRILWSSLIETMVTPMARLDYRNLPNKSNTGVVTQYFYDPQLGVGQFWAWPNPVDSLSGLNFTFMEPIYDFNTSADYPDFPQEWVNALVWNLANEVMLEYDVGGERAARIEKRAAETLDLVSGWDREPESYMLGVNFDQMGV